MGPTLELPSSPTNPPFVSATSNTVITSGTEPRITIPNFMANWPSRKGWPWEPRLHANADKIKVDAEEWVRGYDGINSAFADKLVQDEFPSIACLVFSHLDEAACQLAARVLVHFFIIDEITDRLDESGVRALSAEVMRALENQDGCLIEEAPVAVRMAADIGVIYRAVATKESWELFVALLADGLSGIAGEAASRSKPIMDRGSYLRIRRKTIGLLPFISLIMVACEARVDFIKRPEVEALLSLCVDIAINQNDMYSYDKEQAKGEDGHNGVRVLREQYYINAQEAMNQLGEETTTLIDCFIDAVRDLPESKDDTEDEHLRTLRDGCIAWIIGMEVWSTQVTKRYGMQRLDEKRSYAPMPRRCIPGATN